MTQEQIDNNRRAIVEELRGTGIEGINSMISIMDRYRLFSRKCTRHDEFEGGLANHLLWSLKFAREMATEIRKAKADELQQEQNGQATASSQLEVGAEGQKMGAAELQQEHSGQAKASVQLGYNVEATASSQPEVGAEGQKMGAAELQQEHSGQGKASVQLGYNVEATASIQPELGAEGQKMVAEGQKQAADELRKVAAELPEESVTMQCLCEGICFHDEPKVKEKKDLTLARQVMAKVPFSPLSRQLIADAKRVSIGYCDSIPFGTEQRKPVKAKKEDFYEEVFMDETEHRMWLGLSKTAISQDQSQITNNQASIQEGQAPIQANQSSVSEDQAPIQANQSSVSENLAPMQANQSAVSENLASIQEGQNLIQETAVEMQTFPVHIIMSVPVSIKGKGKDVLVAYDDDRMFSLMFMTEEGDRGKKAVYASDKVMFGYTDLEFYITRYPLYRSCYIAARNAKGMWGLLRVRENRKDHGDKILVERVVDFNWRSSDKVLDHLMGHTGYPISIKHPDFYTRISLEI